MVVAMIKLSSHSRRMMNAESYHARASAGWGYVIAWAASSLMTIIV